MERNSNQFSDAIRLPERKKARFFHIAVKNLNPHKHAQNCYAFLEKICDPSTGESRRLKTVELKWAGYVLPNATILPTSSRYIDGFYVFHDSPNIPFFNPYSDSGDFTPSISGPGDYDLTYIVVSDNFKIIRATFRMHLNNDINHIRFEQSNKES